MRHRLLLILAALLAGFAIAAASAQEALPTLRIDRIPAQPAFAGQTRAPAAPASEYAVETIASGLSAPWALAVLPDGRLLVNEYTGAMRLVTLDGDVSAPITGLPAISHEGWAGLFDVAIDPGFVDNGVIYFSYTIGAGRNEQGEALNTPRVARAVLDSDGLRLTSVEVIVDGFGGQELFIDSGGRLLLSGAGNVFTDDAQDLSIAFGKLLRLERDGSVPPDNPWVEHGQGRPDALSYGHRDISGIAERPGSGEIWVTEHGPRGGDELNRIRPGANFGWKVVSYGTEYTGEPIGTGASAAPGIEQPRYFWRPSIAPSGLLFYTGGMFPEWQDSVFVTALSGQHIARLRLEGDRVAAEERLLVDRAERIRELKQAPDGALYVLTNEESEAPRGTASLLRIYRP